MDSKETQTISLRVTAEELQRVDNAAQEAGLNRPDYIRARIFAPDNSARITQLERQLHELTDRLAREAERQESRRCNNPEHAQLFGVGHCFICDIPMQSSH
jgi:uncharacterized protein (DUF1778 family)